MARPANGRPPHAIHNIHIAQNASGRFTETLQGDEIFNIDCHEEMPDARGMRIPGMIPVMQLGKKRPVLESRAKNLDYRRQTVAFMPSHQFPAAAERQQRGFAPVHLLDLLVAFGRQCSVRFDDLPFRDGPA